MKISMMEIPREAVAEQLTNLLKHGKLPIMNANAIENAVRYLTPVYPEIYPTNMGEFRTCGECGGALRSYDKFCPECGFGVRG